MCELSSESEDEVHQRLCSESELLIRREDVLQRLTPDSCLSNALDSQSDPRWKDLDVEGNFYAFFLSFCSSVFIHLIKHIFLFISYWIRSGETDGPGRGGGRRGIQVSTHQDPCSVQFRRHLLRPATVRGGTRAPQHTRAPCAVTGLFIPICEINLLTWHVFEQKLTNNPPRSIPTNPYLFNFCLFPHFEPLSRLRCYAGCCQNNHFYLIVSKLHPSFYNSSSVRQRVTGCYCCLSQPGRSAKRSFLSQWFSPKIKLQNQAAFVQWHCVVFCF